MALNRSLSLYIPITPLPLLSPFTHFFTPDALPFALPNGRVDIRGCRGHSTHPGLTPERALFGPLGCQRAPGLRLPQLEPGQDGPPEQPALPLPLEQLGLAVSRQYEASARHRGAAPTAACAAHGDAGRQGAGHRRWNGNYRTGPVQQSRAIAVLRTGTQRVYGGAKW